MISQAVVDYANACAYLAQKTLPDFKVYVVDGVAYLQPMNARANQYMIARTEPNEYESYKPMRMTPGDLNLAAEWVRKGEYTVEMESI